MLYKIILSSLLCLATSVWGTDLTPDQAASQGKWEQVISLLEAATDTRSLLLRGEAWRALGYVKKALIDHEIAWKRQAADPVIRAWATRTSAETLLSHQEYAKAATRLSAMPSDSSLEEQAKIILVRGRIASVERNLQAAVTAYQLAHTQAQRAKIPAVSIQAQLGLAYLQPAKPEFIYNLATEAASIEPTYSQNALMLAVADLALERNLMDLTESILSHITPNIGLGRQRLEFYTIYEKLLERQQRYPDALSIIARAVAVAHNVQADDILMRLEWRRGLLFKRFGDNDRAIAALRRALRYLESIRADIPISYQKTGTSSFTQSLAPLYLELTDLLLQKATQVTDAAAQPLLQEARTVQEQLKIAEFQDYLGEICPIATVTPEHISDISPYTAVLYPILLANRLELLLGIGTHQYQATVLVSREEIKVTADELSKALRADTIEQQAKNEFVVPARTMYQWLIAPIADRLQAAHIQTLVVTPDSYLRLVPFAALLDQDVFLVERYAVVTAQSITLLAPHPIAESGNVKALVAGMSTPGPVVDEWYQRGFGDTVYASFVRNRKRVAVRGGSAIWTRALTNDPNVTDTRAISRPPLTSEGRDFFKQALALPGVQLETTAVAKTLSANLILNQDFKSTTFGVAMQKPWEVVHVASHGYFGGSPETNTVA
ncbi:hypothetical protein TI04_03980 [Achromatium sp. WMS2]|nr:hypothetical protein TI04_03980 [Achromatium sp. WMS2]